MSDRDPVEIAGELWLAERQLPMRDAAAHAILDYFIAELPETARMVNCGAVVDYIANDEDSEPESGVYVHYGKQLQFLVSLGLLQIHEDDTWTEEDDEGVEHIIKVYSLTEQAHLVYKATRRKDGFDA